MNVFQISLGLIIGYLSVLPTQASDIPEGFREHRVREGDVLGKIAAREDWDIIRKVNRIDEFHLIAGKKILVPENREMARQWSPLPESLSGETAPREVRIHLDKQYFGIYESGRLIHWGPISSGTDGYETPRGKFKVLWKSRDYYSKKYEAEMPYAVNISDAGYFLHQQSLPGRRASHGCIRLLETDAQKLFQWSQKGDPITIF